MWHIRTGLAAASGRTPDEGGQTGFVQVGEWGRLGSLKPYAVKSFFGSIHKPLNCSDDPRSPSSSHAARVSLKKQEAWKRELGEKACLGRDV